MSPLKSRSFIPKINEEVWVCPNVLIKELNLKFGDQDKDESFEDLMAYKYEECHIKFINSMLAGQKMPVLVNRDNDGDYVLYNGHHRIAVALSHGLKLKVLFTKEDFFESWDRSESFEIVDASGH